MQSYQNILCATDFSAHSVAAVERAVDMAQRNDAHLTLLHVVEYFPEDRSNLQIAPEDADPATFRKEQAFKLLDELAQRLKFETAQKEVRFSSRSAKQEIVQFAMQQNIDLIVLSTHGHHGITGILGSTANGVLQSATCDVLAVRALES